MAMKQFCITLEPKLVKEVDECVKSGGLHSSRNDFVRDAVRGKVMEMRRTQMRKAAKALGRKMLKRGWNGELLTREDKIRIANEFLKEKGIK